MRKSAAGTGAKVYGWGRTSSTSPEVSETLKTATLPIQSDATCTDAWGTDFWSQRYTRFEQTLAAAGGMPETDVAVRWELARDDGFRQIVRRVMLALGVLAGGVVAIAAVTSVSTVGS